MFALQFTRENDKPVTHPLYLRRNGRRGSGWVATSDETAATTWATLEGAVRAQARYSSASYGFTVVTVQA